MRRRLDLAAGFIQTPSVLFLDEPTTGLDPRNRNEVWAAIRKLAAEGTTVLLCTQYLDEADQLAGQIVVVDKGRKIADGTPDQLKRQIGGDQIEVVVQSAEDLTVAAELLSRAAGAEAVVDQPAQRIGVRADDRVRALTDSTRVLQEAGIAVEDIALRRPTLDDVFLRLTGERTEQEVSA
jgi:ABC-2 type transport system ATP-binding protein